MICNTQWCIQKKPFKKVIKAVISFPQSCSASLKVPPGLGRINLKWICVPLKPSCLEATSEAAMQAWKRLGYF